MALVFFGFLLLVLNWIVGFWIYDVSLLPRLLALMVFLALALPFCARPAVCKRFDFSILWNPVVCCFGFYALLTASSLLFAINPTAGFNDLFRTIGAFVVLCLSCLILSVTPHWPVLLVRVVSIAALGACAVGYYQMFSKFGFGVPTRAEAEAVTGLMSNVNLFAGFLNLLLPFCLCGIFIQQGWWRAASAICGLATIFLIVLLQSRASYIGLGVGLFFAGTSIIFFGRNLGVVLSRRGLALTAVGAFLMIAAATVAITTDNPIGHRVRTIFTGDFSKIDGGRLMVWGLTLEMIRDHFFTGVGAGNFTIRMHEYLGRPGHDFSSVLTNWAQPHNDFLWVFAEKGTLGFVIFMAVFLAASIHGLSALRNPLERQIAWITIFALAGLAAYATASCFDFPLERINQQVYLALLLSILVVARHRPKESRGILFWPIGLAAAVAFAMLVIGSIYAVAAIRQEYHVNLARRAIRQEDYSQAILRARLAATAWKTLDPVATPIAFLEGYAHWKSGNTREALPLLQLAREANPNRLYVLQSLGEVYLELGYSKEAIECLDLAVLRYPNEPAPRVLLEKAKSADFYDASKKN
jgi:O-antigen ligase